MKVGRAIRALRYPLAGAAAAGMLALSQADLASLLRVESLVHIGAAAVSGALAGTMEAWRSGDFRKLRRDGRPEGEHDIGEDYTNYWFRTLGLSLWNSQMALVF